MAVPLQTKYLSPYTLRPITDKIPKSHFQSLLHVRGRCSVTTTTKSHNNGEKLVIKNAPPTNDPTLQSTWTHRLWVAAGCTTVFASLAKSVIGGFGSYLWLKRAVAGYAGYIIADLGTGVYHWAIDNYGNESTPIVGTQIEAAQGHHMWPWIILRRQFANNLHALGRGVTITLFPLTLVYNDPVVHGFLSTFAFCILFSQQFHAWAHGTKSMLPPLVVALQDMGLLLSRRQHVNHHIGSYKSYCIVSGAWNKVLDESNFFEIFEMVLYIRLRVRPRSWTDPNSKWMEETEISNKEAQLDLCMGV